jgi:hypothetical protein
MVLTGRRRRTFWGFLTELEIGRQAIWTVRPDGSRQRKVAEENKVDSPRWSAAGDGIYFLRTSQGHTQDLMKVAIDQESGEGKGLASALWTDLQAGAFFTLSADGARLAYSRTQGYSNLWLAQLGKTAAAGASDHGNFNVRFPQYFTRRQMDRIRHRRAHLQDDDGRRHAPTVDILECHRVQPRLVSGWQANRVRLQ